MVTTLRRAVPADRGEGWISAAGPGPSPGCSCRASSWWTPSTARPP